MMQKKKILLLGEYGAFTRRIHLALSRSPDIECVIGVADARRARSQWGPDRALVAVLGDPHSIQGAIKDVFAVVNTRGPFLDRNYTVAEQCAERGVHYVDPADTNEYVSGLGRLTRKAEKSGSLIVTGAAAAPAVSTLLVDMLAPEFDRIREIHACLAPGKNDYRDRATAHAILRYSDHALRMKEKGRWHEFKGWTRPRTVYFPAPVGRRRSYVCDMLDLDIFPKRYGAQTVTFRTALSSRASNSVLSFCRWLRNRGMIRNLPSPMLTLLYAFSTLPGFGDPNGGLGVEVHGDKGGERVTRSIFLVARAGNASAIAAAPSVALVKKWVREGVSATGVTPCVGLLEWSDVCGELLEQDIVLVRT
ncbi:MAG: saccharopine dehydrogenase NADP-binding domain-containing protein [Gammaproteobacteria bacterium]|nr:saccharopine dehydrogenase NADP-binding domain-containing protein [Gammaproteobacteria bacterium]